MTRSLALRAEKRVYSGFDIRARGVVMHLSSASQKTQRSGDGTVPSLQGTHDGLSPQIREHARELGDLGLAWYAETRSCALRPPCEFVHPLAHNGRVWQPGTCGCVREPPSSCASTAVFRR